MNGTWSEAILQAVCFLIYFSKFHWAVFSTSPIQTHRKGGCSFRGKSCLFPSQNLNQHRASLPAFSSTVFSLSAISHILGQGITSFPSLQSQRVRRAPNAPSRISNTSPDAPLPGKQPFDPPHRLWSSTHGQQAGSLFPEGS